jgi:hypothetical protein
MTLVQSFEQRIADLEDRLGKNSTNSSKPRRPTRLRSSDGRRPRSRAASGAGSPAIAIASGPWSRPNTPAGLRVQAAELPLLRPRPRRR